MKILLAGATGFIGSEILSQSLLNPSITSIIILSRRLLPDLEARDPRIKIVVLDNFLVYSNDLVSGLDGVEACLW
jgi:uncharacterized protein YbjT (DUF2867 family)